ncbi:MAG: DUF4124 domain-containing protein [Gammaproteobacteria bacterium]|nr:DUF4124 domain-containing protein [Gammaproteobacteria bacterium]NIR83691.1 DUF4124 domain-containing protein [Gammaproteobacteria bacterium]NIR91666.1 DUF4124 domain-containing protein [Gammaproteobacteria bacterium]NIU04853.1 DUF4124 domain-containing protein [Gammaproteobacteria bacterium]NIV51839.1 DUF4124 domain-containing protein [Gammaproteobacteria bacterium]
MKVLIALLVLIVAIGAYLYFKTDVFDPLLRGTPLERQPASTYLYKWRDARGEWHVSGEPPPAGTPYDRLEYREDTNVLPRPKELQEE